MKAEKITLKEAKARLLEALYGHIGEEHAIGMDALHEWVFDEKVEHKINDTRKLRTLISALRRNVMTIGSVNSRDGGGYYLIRAASELDEYLVRMYRKPALKKLEMEARLRKIALPELLGQMMMNLGQGENGRDTQKSG